MDIERPSNDIDKSYLKKVKEIEKTKECVTIRTKYYTIRTNTPERYHEFDGEVEFKVRTKKKLSIFPNRGKIISEKKEGLIKEYTIVANSIKDYQFIIENV